MSVSLFRGRESCPPLRFRRRFGLMEHAYYGELYKCKTLQFWLVLTRSEKKSNSSRTKNAFTTPLSVIHSRKTRHTPGAKPDFLKCKLNSEVCKDGRWCALTHVLDGVADVSCPAIWILKVPVANGFHALEEQRMAARQEIPLSSAAIVGSSSSLARSLAFQSNCPSGGKMEQQEEGTGGRSLPW
jgi:hypothetical protein